MNEERAKMLFTLEEAIQALRDGLFDLMTGAEIRELLSEFEDE